MRNKNKTSYICTIKILKYNFMENWKNIKGYEGLYKVSSYGRIMTVRKNAILCPAKTISNGLTVSLSKNGKVEKKQVSRLVAAAFIPNPDNKPCVDHIDGVRFHNFVENLRWCTQDENMNYELAIRNKTKYNFPIEGVGYDGKVCVAVSYTHLTLPTN